MPLKLYGVPMSWPTRLVTLTLDVAGADYEYEHVNPMKGETREKEFLKVRNRERTVGKKASRSAIQD